MRENFELCNAGHMRAGASILDSRQCRQPNVFWHALHLALCVNRVNSLLHSIADAAGEEVQQVDRRC
jgi:hypothetical protein